MKQLPWVYVLLVVACGRNDPHAGHEEPGTAPPTEAADPHAGHTTPAAPGAPAPDADMVMPVSVSPQAAAAIGVRTVPARAGSAATPHRAPASATFDPARTRRVPVTAGGQLREERVPRVGEAVQAGQVLVRISPRRRSARCPSRTWLGGFGRSTRRSSGWRGRWPDSRDRPGGGM
ncbi:MAG: hypothetical protein Q8P18_02240 [Pseudomonadota bacterium]|nr:hypothetical protein [Pseudomonadota bacterium]